MRIERFKCFLYGRLIALLLSSSIVFTSKNIILEEEDKEISEIKAFGNLNEYLPKLHDVIFKGELCLRRFFKRIITNFKRFTEKSRKKGRKIALDILKLLEIEADKVQKLVS